LNEFNFGKTLSSNRASELEASLSDGEQIEPRLLLLGFYFQHPSTTSEEKWKEHAFWFLRNRPEELKFGQVRIPSYFSAKTIAQLKREWKKISTKLPHNLLILTNAAKFFSCDFETSEFYWSEAVRLFPSNSELLFSIISLYLIKAAESSFETQESFALRLLQYGETALSMESHRVKRFQLASKLFEFAIQQRKFKQARRYCRIQLEVANEMGIFHSEVYEQWGRLMMHEGKIRAAKMYLSKTLRRPIGVNYELAKTIAFSGDKDFVEKYLKKQQKIFEEDGDIARLQRLQEIFRLLEIQ
jgi:hypothetical protein